MKVFTGDNASKLYFKALHSVLQEGDKCSPRGKEIRELRPACFEFTNPLLRTTFLKGRNYNPFFQLAEALWILSGRADVKWLTQYNKNMASFSDDGVWFNAPYGERLRTWNQSRANDFVFNPIDQLEDVYLKLKRDNDTRQAVALIYNPIFDNINYSGNGGLDTPCNIVLTFKLRHGKLDLTVFNRSNDLHWGVFGANIVQFSTIQETVAGWLGAEVGTYRQITDSLHVYTEDYGAKCTNDIMTAYYGQMEVEPGITQNSLDTMPSFFYETEPRMNTSKEVFESDLMYYWGAIDQYLSVDNPDVLTNEEHRADVYSMIQNLRTPYLRMTVNMMFIFRLYKLEEYMAVMEYLSAETLSQWKIACTKFMYKKLRAFNEERLNNLVMCTLPDDARKFIVKECEQ